MSTLRGKAEAAGWSVECLIGQNCVVRRVSKGIQVSPCPVCGHNECFTIFNDGKWWCFSAYHSSGGDVIDLYAEIHGVSVADAWNDMLKNKGINRKEIQERIKNVKSIHKRKHMNQRRMSNRAFDNHMHALRLNTEQYKHALKWGFDIYVMGDVGLMKDYGDRWGFVMADTDSLGVCKGAWSIKYTDKQVPKTRTHIKKFGLGVGYALSLLHSPLTSKPTELVITSGFKDLMSVRMLGYTAVGLDGEGYLPTDVENLLKKLECPKVFFLDADEPGQVATMKHIQSLRDIGIKVGSVKHSEQWSFAGKDVTDYRTGGVPDAVIKSRIDGAIDAVARS